ncbi:hypothetical protein MMC25_004462 [Agyrium rufum]|nr:hypothetical protein [Agyrium rufum]
MESFFRKEVRKGPFILTLTDLHQSNIFVDDDWHITAIIDLEWACTRPLDMQYLPYWLGGPAIDLIDVDIFSKAHEEFLAILQEEELRTEATSVVGQKLGTPTPMTHIMQEGWKIGTTWFCLAIDSVSGMHSIFYEHIQPKFDQQHLHSAEFYRIVSQYWSYNAQEFVEKKLNEKAEYDKALETAFTAQTC